ncbi:MAG: hypothetical protein ACRYFZ_20030 [Janthinobacterium lividum]
MLLLWLAVIPAVAQQSVAQQSPLQQLGGRLRRGDQQALLELAPYLDSHRVVTEFLGYHVLKVEEASIAKRLLTENCLFTASELNLDSAVSARQFTTFLAANRSRLVFSPLATAFLLTPLEQRTAITHFRVISPARQQELEARAADLFGQPWAQASKVDSLVAHENPAALLVIAAELFKVRERFNEYIAKEEYTDLLQLLTGTEIGTENERHEISWHLDKDFEPASQLNLLIYLTNAYRHYTWNQREHRFVNPAQTVAQPGREKELFDLLSSPIDSTATRAFTQLTACPPALVGALAVEQDKADINTNYALPTFPYRFLPQLALLTEYCRANGLNYTGSTALRQAIAKLKTDLSFAERYHLENQLINSLAVSESTALEYWTLINEDSFQLVFSSGRILDILYSRHWPQLLADRQQLNCYLKKAALFDRLGIIGSCSSYLLKFSNSSPATLKMLTNYQTSDNDIRQQIRAVLTNPAATHRPVTAPGSSASNHNVGNDDHTVLDLETRFRALAPQGVASAAQQQALVELLANINYQQIGTTLKLLEPIQFAEARQKYSFMQSDWGFFSLGDFDQPAVRNEFLQLYTRLSEYDLYSHYLNEAGIDYRRPDQTLDYDKLYELLKFDNTRALAGGGGATDKKEVYALVKLLELHFHTTLGFPHKFCNSASMYGCSLVERTNAWLTYLTQHQLLKRPHQEPPSFSLE